VLRYVDAATAAVVAARALSSERAIVGLLAHPLQCGLVTVEDLIAAEMYAPPRGRQLVGRAIHGLAAGARSASEVDAQALFATSKLLSKAVWNVWLRLPDGGPLVSPDALLVDAGMAVEVNGKRYHAWGNMFDDTQARQLRLTAAGIVVAPVTPTRLIVSRPTVLRELEAVYVRNRGRGLPPGVEIVAMPRRAA